MTYTWQSVTKNIHIEDLGLKLERRLDKIKTQLIHFPQNSVHLNISLEKNAKKELFTARLTLRLPSNILHAEKDADHVMTAFDNAADALVREIQALKSDLRGDYRWEQSGRRAALHESKLTRFPGMPPDIEPESVTLNVAEMFDEDRDRVREFARRQIEREELAGRIPGGEIDLDDLVNTVAHRALAEHDQKPEGQTYKTWFYRLAHVELQRRYRMLHRPAELAEFERARPIIRKFNPPVSEPLAELFPDLAPESQADLLHSLQEQSVDWPEEDRAIFDLRFLEAFSPEEIAVIIMSSTDRVCDTCHELETRIRGIATAVR